MTHAASKKQYAPRLPPAQRREQLLDSALAVIGADGYAGVSMEAIARTAGVTKPVVYAAFGDLGTLLRALLERQEKLALSQVSEALPSQAAMDPDELVVAGLTAFLTTVGAHPTTWRLILMPAEGTPELVRDHVEAGRKSVRERIEELLARGLEARGGPEGIDVELASHCLIAIGEHLGRLMLTRPERYSPERIGTFVASLLGALERPNR